ncbi:MAG: hypothetical protein ACJAZN_001527, partial [Planctomycetota bacterium]
MWGCHERIGVGQGWGCVEERVGRYRCFGKAAGMKVAESFLVPHCRENLPH